MRPASGWLAVQRPTAMGPDGGPPQRHSIALLIVAHPVDLVDVQAEIGERRQQAASHRLDLATSVTGAVRRAVPADVLGVRAVDGAEVTTVERVVHQLADEVVDVESPTMELRIGVRLPGALQPLDLGHLAIRQRCQRAGVAVSAGGVGDVDAELRELRSEVVDDPLLVDLVVADDTVGNDPAVDAATRRRAPTPVTGVVADIQRTVRRDETLFVVARPDHFVGAVAHLRKGVDPLDRPGDHLLDAVARPTIVEDAARRRVGVVDVADVLVFPDAMGDADDVVDDVDVRLLEPAHRLAARAALDTRFRRAIADLEGDREVLRHLPLHRAGGIALRPARDVGGGTVGYRPLHRLGRSSPLETRRRRQGILGLCFVSHQEQSNL